MWVALAEGGSGIARPLLALAHDSVDPLHADRIGHDAKAWPADGLQLAPIADHPNYDLEAGLLGSLHRRQEPVHLTAGQQAGFIDQQDCPVCEELTIMFGPGQPAVDGAGFDIQIIAELVSDLPRRRGANDTPAILEKYAEAEPGCECEVHG